MDSPGWVGQLCHPQRVIFGSQLAAAVPPSLLARKSGERVREVHVFSFEKHNLEVIHIISTTSMGHLKSHIHT